MAFNYKKALALALSAAMVVTAAPVAGLDVQAAAKKQGTAATKITPTKTSYSVKVGKSTAAITLKLNKKTTKKVTINLKSSNKKVATVSKSKVTIKKGKAGTKSASFKIKGVKKGSTTVVASFVNSKGKTVSKKITVKVTKAAATKVAVTGVTLSNTTPKVGDTLTAKVTPSDASSVKYAWYTGDTASLTTEIAGATSKTLSVTEDMIGKFVGVVVTDGTNNKSYTAVSAVAVQKADSTAIAVTEAKQTGMATVALTFSNKVTVQDKITVKKGGTEKEYSVGYADDFKSATLTMKDNLSAGTYSVTLTPADSAVAPSTVEFTAVSATKATSIAFDNNYLVLADTLYQKGYCFVHGKNDFGENITLSGLTITAAPSDSTSYDSSTGKITVESNTKSQYAIVKTVSVFVQYTSADGTPLTANANLEVSSIGYPSKVTFGEVKKDGTPRDDGKLTMAELGSNKYYIELSDIEDQYGNTMTVDDLNYLVTESLLTVVPTPGSNSMFIGTNATPFGEVNGKIVMFLTRGNNMPGTAKLMLTSAGGSFEKEITVYDNPFINTMVVDIPDVYEGETTDVLSFTAKDQYESDVDLYDFAPVPRDASGKNASDPTHGALNVLTFTDANNMTKNSTKITASDAGTWTVKKDTAKKTFEVKYTPAGATKSKSVITFTTITAGMTTNVATVTVGEKGGARQIVPQSSSVQIDPANPDYNFAEKLQFKDANGKLMKRADGSASYPLFLDPTLLGAAPAGGGSPFYTDSSINESKYGATYYWTLTDKKLATNAPSTATTLTGADKGIVVDHDGVIDATGDLTIGAGATSGTFYVSLLVGNTATADYVVLDSEAFRFNYVPTSAATKYVVQDQSKELLYAAVGSKDTQEIKLTATNNSGESWEVTTGITLAPDAPFTSSGNVLSGDIATNFDDNTDGEVSVKVYHDGDPVDTVKIKYSNRTPKAASTEVKIWAKANNAAAAGVIQVKKYDFKTTDKSFTTSSTATSTEKMTDGTFAMTNVDAWGDDLTAVIKDQYDVVMGDSTVKLNGEDIVPGTSTVASGKTGNFVITNGDQKIDLDIKNGNATGFTFNATQVVSKDFTAANLDELKTALKRAKADSGSNKITITNSFAATSTALDIDDNDTIVVETGVDVTAVPTSAIAGTLKLSGTITAVATGNIAVANLEIPANAQNAAVTTSGGGLLTISKKLNIAAGAKLTTADLTLGANAEVSHKGTKLTTGVLTTVTEAQNLALATPVTLPAVADLDTTGTPTTITGAVSVPDAKTVSAINSVLYDFGTVTDTYTANWTGGTSNLVRLYVFDWPGEVVAGTSKWGFDNGGAAPAATNNFTESGTVHHFTVMDQLAHTYGYSFTTGATSAPTYNFSVAYRAN